MIAHILDYKNNIKKDRKLSGLIRSPMVCVLLEKISDERLINYEKVQSD